MKVLVTGAGGFLGVRVVERLIAHGFQDIRCFLRDPAKAGALEALAQEHSNARLEFYSGNLRSGSDCARALDGVHLVFHLAAGLKGSPAELFADSVVSSRNLLDAIAARPHPAPQGTRVILVSSFGVYGTAALESGDRINEQTPLEVRPDLRDPYSHSKLRQEQLFWEYAERTGFELVVLRPGVIYGPGGSAFSNRVGLQVGPVFAFLGGNNLLPLSYVANCAEAIVVAGTHQDSAGQAFNVHDDELPTAANYLRQYKRQVRKILAVRLPYTITSLLAWSMEAYHLYSLGQLPAVITRYKARVAWRGHRFDNSKLRSLGWRQLVSTTEGMNETFRYLRIAAHRS